jgi:PAS domain S-box-containing protein
MTPPEYEALDEDARRQVRETGVHLPFEKEFIRKDGSRIWGLISAVAYEDDRTQGISFLLDITKRKRAEEALRESEKRYRNLFNAMTEGFCIVEVLFDSDGKPEDYRFLEVNGAFERQTGLHDAAGKRMRELVPAHEEHWFEMYGKVALTGEPARFINEARALNRWYDVHAYRVGEPEMRRVAIVFDDFSDYKRAEEQLQKLNRTLEARSNSDQAILHATEEPAFLREVCRIITRDCGHAMVWIGVAEDDVRKTVRPVAHSGFEEGYLETLSVTWDESERGRGPTGTAIRTGQPSMCRDMHIDPAFAPWREDAVKRGYASSLVIPLKEQGVAWGAITIYSREPDAFTEGEVELLTELAGDLEFGIETLRLRAAHARAEEALRESEELLGLFVEHAPAALAMFDGQMRYLHASRRWRADYGLGDQELSGVSHYEVFPEIPELWKDAHRRGLAGEVLSGEADRFEKADGSVQWVRWEVRPWRDAEGEVGGIVIFSEEISERKKAQEALLRSEKLAYQRQQLQALAERLQQAREEERKMVARDLHDDIGQILTAIKMDMSWVVRHLPRANDEVHDRLKGSIELINDGVRSVRKICSGLRPGILDDLGLAAAIEWQSNEFAARTGISCQVSVPAGELVLDGDRATAIFRIFQECLTNVARHAEARSVRATLRAEDENLLLVVQDDGKGFRESEVAGSLGVLGMKERAQACGGSVQVSSSPGKGTTVTVRVPVRAPSAELEDHAYSDSR